MFSFASIRAVSLSSNAMIALSSHQRLLPIAPLCLKLSSEQNNNIKSRDMSSVHGGMRDFRKNYLIKKEYPVGPHKKLPPFVKHKDKRTGEVRQGTWENYKYKVH